MLSLPADRTDSSGMMLPGKGWRVPLARAERIVQLDHLAAGIHPIVEVAVVHLGRGYRTKQRLRAVAVPEASYEKKKNDLLRPSYNFGIQTGPPTVPPKSCCL